MPSTVSLYLEWNYFPVESIDKNSHLWQRMPSTHAPWGLGGGGDVEKMRSQKK